MTNNFDDLTPLQIIPAIEEAMGISLTGLLTPFTSYINRVYEVQTTDDIRLVAKFYRPGRWELEGIQDEHDYLLECAAEEIPVIAPLRMKNGGTIGEVDGIYFAVFPKMSGRQFELNTPEDWKRAGRVIGRIHSIGMRKDAPNRLELHPLDTTDAEIELLLEGGFVTPQHQQKFYDVTGYLMDEIIPLFDDVEYLRIHGDAHNSNFLDRLNGDILVIDFDDMLVGPAIQDLWLLLPDHWPNCREKLNLMLEGYELFKDFNDAETKLIEPLRAMRIIYFTAWCSTQVNDFRWRQHYPNWGNDAFWAKEIKDLQHQLEIIRKLNR